MAWTTKPVMIMPEMFFKQNESDLMDSTYGFGLFLATLDGWQYNYRSGFMSPYVSLMSLFPSQNLGVFTSVNEGPLLLDVVVVHAFIFQLLRGQTADKAREYSMQLIKKDTKFREIKKAKMLSDVEKLLKESQGKMRRMDAEIVRKYGSGASGDAEILEKFRNKHHSVIRSIWKFPLKWYKGWLENVSGPLYRITWDTDIVQEFYAGGFGFEYLVVENDTMEFAVSYNGELLMEASFRLIVSLDKLPSIAWSSESCGPVNVTKI